MNGIFKISLCLTVFAVLAGLSGCEPKEQVNERQERLYSVENTELKKQIAKLKDKYEEDLAVKQQQLDKCQADMNNLSEQLAEETFKTFEQSVVDALAKENKRLQDENNRLKAEIEDLNKKLEPQE
jgi:flagellar motility protein MotE (MotC chaperone)